MSKYRVIYTTFVELEAADAWEALNLASKIELNDFIFYDAETELLEDEEDY